MHRELNVVDRQFRELIFGDRPTDVDDNGNRKVVVGK
jgi:hypothetical protein